jgi:uncharacterized protein (TIGR02466 family)
MIKPNTDTGDINFDLNIKVLKPFGPVVMKTTLPIPVYKELETLTDEIIADKDKINWGPQLAGQIEKELLITQKMCDERNLTGFFNLVAQRYVKECNVMNDSKSIQGMKLNLEEDDDIVLGSELTSMWIVSQYENEYNPVHFHTYSTISAVLYLKIPEYEPREIYGKSKSDGDIEFIYHATPEDHISLQRGCMVVSPVEGDLFMFPSYLLHTVYPFKGKSERRSVSMNFVHQYMPKSEFDKEAKKGKKKK